MLDQLTNNGVQILISLGPKFEIDCSEVSGWRAGDILFETKEWFAVVALPLDLTSRCAWKIQ